jgi:hypothetical protein
MTSGGLSIYDFQLTIYDWGRRDRISNTEQRIKKAEVKDAEQAWIPALSTLLGTGGGHFDFQLTMV